MAEVSEAANRVYLLSGAAPRQHAVIRNPEGKLHAYGIRAHNQLGANWRSVYELLGRETEAERVLEEQRQRIERADVEFDLIADGYTFWFSGPTCCAYPAAVTSLIS